MTSNETNAQIQLSHGTQMDRYPDEYNMALDFFTVTKVNRKQVRGKILLFGCSTREEPLTLAQKHFVNPNVKVYGVDVADHAVKTAARKAQEANMLAPGKITTFDGRTTSPLHHGPFDVLFANSIFCIYGYQKVSWRNIDYVMNAFPYEKFELMIQHVDLFLKVGEILAICSNYAFIDAVIGKTKYEVLDDKKCSNHFVPCIDLQQKKFVDLSNHPMDCLYVKKTE
ncbi:hypothetical protein ACA910_008224 [Epithemia clementina (nom. ined.)]